MAAKVFFVDQQRIYREIESDNDKNLSDTEKATADELIEMVSKKSQLVLFNTANLAEETAIAEQQLKGRQETRGLDMSTVMRASILFHAYSHLFTTKEQFDITPINLTNSSGVVTATITRFNGYDLVGTNADGKRAYYTGGNEAVTDFMGTLAGQDATPYVTGSAYKSGVKLVEALNNMANVDEPLFIDAFSGKRSAKDLFTAWGRIKNNQNPDINAALQAFIIIGLRVKNSDELSQEQAQSLIEGVLTPGP